MPIKTLSIPKTAGRFYVMVFCVLSLLSVQRIMAQCPSGQIVYVNDNATGASSGTSWTDAYTDLQDALTSAAACPNVTEIWVAEGTYFPDQGGGNTNNDRSASFVMQNNLAIYGGFSGTESTLNQRDWMAHPTILSGDIDQDSTLANNSYHIIFNDQNGLDSTAILDGFTVTAGHADGPSFPDNVGGGMYNSSSSPKLTNCIFRDNSANSGGGMYNRDFSLPQLIKCSFIGNSADNAGGGMCNVVSSAPHLTNCKFQGNSAGNDGGGGGMYNSNSSSHLINCRFTGNSAAFGGGLYNAFSSSPQLINCIFQGNSADDDGGGIYNSSSSPILTNCKFQGNSAAFGGGLYNVFSSSPQLTNCKFQGNSADDEGGGMLNFSSSPHLINCTFQGNSAGNEGGGLYNANFSTPTLINCILWENSNEIVNDASSNATVTFSIVEGGYAAGTNILDADPLFVDAANGDLRLLPCSPAIDAGTAVGAPDTDLEGNPRIDALPGPGLVDIGAYEFQNSGGYDTRIYVDADAIAGNNNGTTWNDAFIDLQTAISSARACGVDTIWVAEGTYYPDQGGGNTNNDRSASLVMHNNLAIYGGFSGTEIALSQRDWVAHPTILSGDIDQDSTLANNSYHVIFNDNNDLDSTAMLDGFTITGGNANGSFPEDAGGGMYNSSSSPKLANCIFRDNSAEAGGGMYNSSSSPKLTNCIFRDNSAEVGGGMSNVSSSPTLTNCIFRDNLADVYGGGMYNNDASPTLTNCTFEGNSADLDGGGVHNRVSSSPILANCSFIGNSADSDGGGIYNSSSSPSLTITNCNFQSNSAKRGSGIFNQASSPKITNCSFHNNSALLFGGSALHNNFSSAIITNCIFWENGDEIYNSARSTVTVSSSIVQGGFAAGTNILDVDPLFVDAANGDLRLLVCSPAIDAGDDMAVPDSITTDLDGNPRIFDATGANAVDMGAYEYPSAYDICTTCLTSGNILYVSGNASGENDGTSWDNAFVNLQDALALASTCPNVTQIWVAQGTYYPDEGGNNTDNDRNAAFVMQNGLAIYGGFAGIETMLSQRDWVAHPTILSGDINGDSDLAGNSYHVIFNDNNGLDSTAVLDGFTIAGGNADGSSSPNNRGGGMFNQISSSPTLTNCFFAGNSAILGAGMFNQSSSSLTLTNCFFAGNSAILGGGMFNDDSSPTLTNCTFQGNSADLDGGGMYNDNSSSPTLTNCILWGNGSEIVNVDGSTPNVSFSIVEGGYASGTNILDVDPLFVDASNGDLRLSLCSPAIDAGTTVGAPDTDLDGNSRVDALPGPGLVDIGAYEFQDIANTVEVVCDQITVALGEEGQTALPAAQLDGGSTGCGMLDFTVNNADTLYVDCTQVGTFSVTLTATDDRQQTGSATCSVTVIGQGNCPLSEPCSDTPLELNDDPIAAGIYRSTTTISSAGRIAGGTEVIMEAQQTISLQPPFQTEPNASFRARITNCDPLRSAATNEQELDEQAKAQETYEFQLDRPANRPLGPNELRVFPNPFRQQATVALRLAVDNQVDIQLFDMTGRLIATVWPSGPRGAGEHHFVLNVPGLQPGVYVLVAQIGKIRYNRRLTVIR